MRDPIPTDICRIFGRAIACMAYGIELKARRPGAAQSLVDGATVIPHRMVPLNNRYVQVGMFQHVLTDRIMEYLAQIPTDVMLLESFSIHEQGHIQIAYAMEWTDLRNDPALKGAGRPKGTATGRRMARLYVTDEEEAALRAHLETLRGR